MVKRIPNRRDRRPHENGGPKTKRARRSTSDQEEDSNSEDEEQEEGMVNSKSQKTNGVLEAHVKQEEDLSDDAEQNGPDAEKRTGLTNGVKVENSYEQNEETCRVNGDVKEEEMESEQSVVKAFTESPKPYAEMQSQASVQMEQESVATTTTEPSGDEQKPCVQSESVQPTADVPPPQPVKRVYYWVN